MKPKEYLKQLETDVPRAIDDLDFAYRQGLYEGAKQMLLVDNVDSRAFLCSLVEAVCAELPEPKTRKR